MATTEEKQGRDNPVNTSVVIKLPGVMSSKEARTLVKKEKIKAQCYIKPDSGTDGELCLIRIYNSVIV